MRVQKTGDALTTRYIILSLFECRFFGRFINERPFFSRFFYKTDTKLNSRLLTDIHWRALLGIKHLPY
jgi:hypothetical protein